MSKKEIVSKLLKCLNNITTTVCSEGIFVSAPRDTMNKALVILSHNSIVSKRYLDQLIIDLKRRIGDNGSVVIVQRQLLDDVVYCLEQERNRLSDPFLFAPGTRVEIELAYNLRASDCDRIPIEIYNVTYKETKSCVFFDYERTRFIIETLPIVFEIIVDNRIYQFEFSTEIKHRYIYKQCKEEIIDEN